MWKRAAIAEFQQQQQQSVQLFPHTHRRWTQPYWLHSERSSEIWKNSALPTWLFKSCNQSVTLSRNKLNTLSVSSNLIEALKMEACTEHSKCARPLTMRKWTCVSLWGGGEGCVCVCVSCHLAGLSPADLVPLSCDIIRAIISLGQIVLSEAQIVWVTGCVGHFFVCAVEMAQCAHTASGVKCRK